MLLQTICIMAPFPFPQLSELREKYIYNIRPLTSSFALVKKGLQIFQSDDEEEADQADDQIMLANWYVTNAFNSNKIKGMSNRSKIFDVIKLKISAELFKRYDINKLFMS